VPQLNGGQSADRATGYEYVYYDSTIDKSPNKKDRKVDKSPYLLTSGKGAMNLTLNSVFNKKSSTIGWILYNDEKPAGAKGKDDGNLGHTKGVIAFDTASKTAYWLLHSWPKFADPGAKNDPTPKYGQTYLCISMDIATAGQIAAKMTTHQEPQVYLPNTANLPKTDPLYILSQPLTPHPAPVGDSIDLKSKAGMPFKVIAKNREWDQDFWNGLVGPEIKEDIDVDTWIRGPIPPVQDTDGIHKTFDIKYVNMGALGLHWVWPETHDHAKWGISIHSDWVIVGDINRMISQRKRGGGAIAFQNETLWKALSKTGLLLAPPGHTRDEARALAEATHKEPVIKKTPAKKAAPAAKARKPRKA
jgi:deoxyribonuclease-2